MKTLLILGLVGCGAAHAQANFALHASAVTNGSYTVSYAPDCDAFPPDYSCKFTYLQEKIGANGTWSNVSSGTGSITFSNRPDASYFYRVHSAVMNRYFQLYEIYSPEISVVVSATPVRENILEQLTYDYEVRQGDINGDGRLDLFVRRASGRQALNGTIEQIILRQDAGKKFSALVPTAYQSQLASSWPVSPVEPVLEDFNADGYVDVALTGMSAVLDGADDQFVYAPGQPGLSQPKGVRSFDADMVRFVSNMMDYFFDQDYFVDYAPTYYYQAYYWYTYCGYVDLTSFFYNPESTYFWTDPYCYVDYFYQVGVYQDFSSFSDEALTFWQNDYKASQGYLDENVALAQVVGGIERLIGVAIGGWSMEDIFGDAEGGMDPYVRGGLEIARAIIAMARGGSDGTKSRLMPPQEARWRDHIYITGHPLQFARSRGHLALEHTDALGGGFPYTGETLSAEPEHDSISDFGKLIARTNRPTDHPLINYFVAEVEPQKMSNDAYWTSYLLQRHMNYIALPYDQKPRYALVPREGTGSHNSNSYINGITDDNPANVVIDLPPGIGKYYPGWDVPVPNSKFQ